MIGGQRRAMVYRTFVFHFLRDDDGTPRQDTIYLGGYQRSEAEGWLRKAYGDRLLRIYKAKPRGAKGN